MERHADPKNVRDALLTAGYSEEAVERMLVAGEREARTLYVRQRISDQEIAAAVSPSAVYAAVNQRAAHQLGEELFRNGTAIHQSRDEASASTTITHAIRLL